MKIQCNNCTKIYLVPSEQIGEFGRKVRCTNCNHTWYEYLQESDRMRVPAEEKKVGGGNLLVFTTLAFAVVVGLCLVVANPKEVSKVYKAIGLYKDSVGYKLGYKKKQTNRPDTERLTTSKFYYQDHLFLPSLGSG